MLSLCGIEKSYGGAKVIAGVSLEVRAGEFLTLLGPSGCGKTTILRIIAGLEDVDAGAVVLEGEDITKVPPERRSVNTVFQNYALFPHMSVFQNIAYGPRLRKIGKAEISRRVLEMLELVRMEGYEQRMPHQLSGGQRQRIAIARALINNPKILLLDEPLGALDLQLRRHMQGELRRIQRHMGTTFVYVTHDQHEALDMSDRMAIMNGGSLEQVGAPDEVYTSPATLFVAGFVGDRNILRVGEFLDYRLPGGVGAGSVVVHTDKVRLSATPFYEGCISGVVSEKHRIGSEIRTVVMVGRTPIRALAYNEDNGLVEGQEAYVSWDVEDGVALAQ